MNTMQQIYLLLVAAGKPVVSTMGLLKDANVGYPMPLNFDGCIPLIKLHFVILPKLTARFVIKSVSMPYVGFEIPYY
jgi:hypothetical protein